MGAPAPSLPSGRSGPLAGSCHVSRPAVGRPALRPSLSAHEPSKAGLRGPLRTPKGVLRSESSPTRAASLVLSRVSLNRQPSAGSSALKGLGLRGLSRGLARAVPALALKGLGKSGDFPLKGHGPLAGSFKVSLNRRPLACSSALKGLGTGSGPYGLGAPAPTLPSGGIGPLADSWHVSPQAVGLRALSPSLLAHAARAGPQGTAPDP